MNGNSPDLRWRIVSRVVDLVSDAAVVVLVLVAVQMGALPRETGLTMVGYALRALVHPSGGIGVFLRGWPGVDTPA